MPYTRRTDDEGHRFEGPGMKVGGKEWQRVNSELNKEAARVSMSAGKVHVDADDYATARKNLSMPVLPSVKDQTITGISKTVGDLFSEASAKKVITLTDKYVCPNNHVYMPGERAMKLGNKVVCGRCGKPMEKDWR